MKYKDAHTKILTAQKLFMEPTVSLDTVKRISTLLKGINPKVDAALMRAEKELETFEKIYGGHVVELGAEHLPEDTEEKKNRKKALLFFIRTWKDLQGEVSRVQAELAGANSSQNSGDKTTHWGRVFNFAKGPLGIVTIVAVGVVLVMQQVGVELVIKNQGCGTMVAAGSMPLSLPGFSLPKDPIVNGGSGKAVLPPLTVSVDGTNSMLLTLKALAFSAQFELPANISAVTLDDVSLLHTKQDIHLSDQKSHILRLICS